MATLIGISSSDHQDPLQAFREAAIDLKQQTNQSECDLAFILGTSAYLPKPESFEAVQKILQAKKTVYMLTGGMILPRSIQMKGVAIMSIKSDDIQFSGHVLNGLSSSALQQAGIRLGRAVSASLTTQRQALYYFVSGPGHNNSPFIRGLQEGVGVAFPIVGGISSDVRTPGESVTGMDGQTYTDAAVALLVGGQLTFAIGTGHGWQPLGRRHIITHAEGHIIRQIDGKPAINLYTSYFEGELHNFRSGKLGEISLLYPLGIGTGVPRQYLVRYPVEALPDGSIVCQSDIASGSPVHVMIGDKDACRETARNAAIDVREQLKGRPPKLVLILESLARRKLFGRSAWQEIAAIKDILGLTVPVFGMYTYGEIAPQGRTANMYNIQTQSASITITAIG